jgi:hypothetical protein
MEEVLTPFQSEGVEMEGSSLSFGNTAGLAGGVSK